MSDLVLHSAFVMLRSSEFELQIGLRTKKLVFENRFHSSVSKQQISTNNEQFDYVFSLVFLTTKL